MSLGVSSKLGQKARWAAHLCCYCSSYTHENTRVLPVPAAVYLPSGIWVCQRSGGERNSSCDKKRQPVSSDSTPIKNPAPHASYTVRSVATHILSKLGVSLDNLLVYEA